ncbi:MAG: ACP S-malonyltransferase, partial [Anaerolineae bacterium]|nr:ACP S-malonyltransferase [Anaerolineae bacterium]
MTHTQRHVALLFPGQGCQFVGMGADLYAAYPEARAIYDQADEVLDFSLSKLCFEGPQEALDDTANTQPAIYTTALALWQVLSPRLGAVRDRIACLAGHSLGEFCALAIAGAFDFADGLRLVRRRGEAMRDAGAKAPGGMAVIIGLADEEVAAIVAEANGEAEEEVWIANLNSPGQVVIAGRHEGLERALALAKARKAKRALPLAVSVACHTPLMREAAASLGEALERTCFTMPWAPVVCNSVAEPLSEVSVIKAALLCQLYSPVRWVESIERMVADGVSIGLEVGPRQVVSGLIRRIDASLALYGVTDAASIDKLDVEA